MNDTTEEVLEKLQGTTRKEAQRIVEALDCIPEEKLPPLLTFLKGLNYLKLEEMEQANRVLLSLYEDDIEAVPYRTSINDIRISHRRSFSDSRPKILTNALGGRIGLSIMANADTVFFTAGDRLERTETACITYRADEDSFQDILQLLPQDWKPDYVLFFLSEVFSLPLGLEASPYPVIGLPGDPWKLNKASQDIHFFDGVMPAITHMCPPHEKLGRAKVLYTSCAGIQGHIPWMIEKVDGVSDQKDLDVLFTGVTSSPFYRQRSRYLWKLLNLADRRKVFVGYFSNLEEFYRMMVRAKIVVHCPSIQGGVNLRPFEAISLGALVLHEEGDGAIREFFEPGKEIVLFNEDNFDELVEYYLTHDEEREKIVARAQERNARDANIRLSMKKAIAEVYRNKITVSNREARSLPEDRKWNALGISDFYAVNYGRASRCFSNALQMSGKLARYQNNLAVCLMIRSLLEEHIDTDIEALLLSANREECATPVSRFNIISFYRTVRPDSRKFLRWAGEYIRDLRTGGGNFPEFTGDELFFYMEGPGSQFSESSIFRIEMEHLLFRYPERGPAYQEGVLGTLLWRVLEYLGDCYVQMGQLPSAMSAYELALKEFSRNELILKKLSDIQIHLGLFEQAKSNLKKLLDLSPLHEETHFALCKAETALGDHGDLCARLEQLLHFQGLKNKGELQSYLTQAKQKLHERPSA